MEELDSIIVLSYGLTPEDRKLTPLDKRRVEKGVELFEFGLSDNLIMNGGPGIFAKVDEGVERKVGLVPRGSMPVHAQVMKKYAIELGVPEERILLQEFSSDSVGEAYFVKKQILEPMGFRRNCIVSSPSHIPRAGIIYNRVLGPEYSTTFISTMPMKIDEEPATWDHERKSLEMFLEQLGKVEPGDDEKFEDLLYRVHGIYSAIPEEQRLRFYPH